MPMRVNYADANLEVGEWWCPGATRAVGPEESLPMHEIVIARVGGHVRQIGSKRVIIDAAHVVSTSAGVSFRSVHAMGLPQRATYIKLADALVDDIRPMRERIPVSPALALAHARLVRAARVEGPGSALAVHEAALGIVSAVVHASREPKGERSRIPRSARAAVEATAQTLAFRFAEDLSLEGLAHDVGLSSWYLSRIFRRVMGVSIWQHVTVLRLHASLDRLAQGEVNLSDLALALGFSSHSHFSAAFRRAFGISPSMTRF